MIKITFNYTTKDRMQEIALSYDKMGYKPSDRRFSVDVEWAYRLTHPDFDSRTTQEAADIMGLTQRRVQQLLQQLHFIAPQLFTAPSSNKRVFNALFNREYLPKRVRSSVDLGWGF